MVAEVRPELRETLKQAKITAFESRGDFKAFMEDFNSIENMRGRRATMRAGESVAALAARIEADTLPLVNQSLRRSDEAINAAKGLISNADQSLNRELLPEATKLLASLRQTSDAFGVEGRAILAEILVLTKQGQTSLEAVNKVLGSPEWLSILKSLDGTAKNIEATSAAMPAIAQSVEKIAQTSAKFTKAILIAQLLATIAGALIP
jgi:hypothetical protein